jgi:hypothetical protein
MTDDSKSQQSPSDSESLEGTTTTQDVSDNITTTGQCNLKKKKPKHHWRAEHFKTFPWIQYDEQSKTASCKYPRCPTYVFNPSSLTCSKWKDPSLEYRLFVQHEKSKRHLKQFRPVLPKGQKPFRLPADPDLDNDDIWTRIHCVWWLAKEDIAMHKYPSHLEAYLVKAGLAPPRTYKDEPFAWELVEILGHHFRKKLELRIQKSPCFGIMADETTDTSVDQQLIVYIKFLDQIDGKLQPIVCYLDLVSPESGSAEDIKVL